MIDVGKAASRRFCWLDLAAHDAERAKLFYAQAFGWTSHEQPANGGRFTRLYVGGHDAGSLYQLSRALVDRGVPSHWTPYVCVDDVDDMAQRAVAIGGEVIVHPFTVSGVARIALITDSVGARLGLWEPIDPSRKESACG